MYTARFRLCSMALAVGLCLSFSATAFADTLTDIKTNVKANSAAVSDISCTADISYTDAATYLAFNESWADWVDALVMKSTTQVWFSIIGNTEDSRYITNDGTTFTWKAANGLKAWKDSSYIQSHDDGPQACDRLMDFGNLLDNNTWSLDAGTVTISGIQCYRISCTDYYMYVDTATTTKVMKVEDRQQAANYVLLSSYSYVENTAYVPQVIDHYWLDSTRMTVTCSDIDINESLTSSNFAAP